MGEKDLIFVRKGTILWQPSHSIVFLQLARMS